MRARLIAVSAVLAWTALLSLPTAAPAKLFSRVEREGQASESVARGVIVWSNREGTELVLGNGLRLTVPVSLPGIIHTDLKPGRPIEAYYKKEGGKNVVTLMFTQGVHPGGGG
jgi:hypothetical protein